MRAKKLTKRINELTEASEKGLKKSYKNAQGNLEELEEFMMEIGAGDEEVLSDAHQQVYHILRDIAEMFDHVDQDLTAKHIVKMADDFDKKMS
jgi:hypothetical protein